MKWIRYNKTESLFTCDGLAYDVMGAPNLPKFISRAAISIALREKTQAQSDGKKIDSSSHLVVLTHEGQSRAQWIQLGRKLQRFLLELTRLGLSYSFFNQPTEIPQLRHEMAGSLGPDNGIPVLVLRLGYGRSVPYSKRRAPVVMERQVEGDGTGSLFISEINIYICPCNGSDFTLG
ncbi:MAG: hypothetical protein LUE10_04140 [Alistipes sp.]|nr:hypothetical protein [Alistipes sp.]